MARRLLAGPRGPALLAAAAAILLLGSGPAPKAPARPSPKSAAAILARHAAEVRATLAGHPPLHKTRPVHLDPRSPRGLLQRLGLCQSHYDLRCIDTVLAGGELIARTQARRLLSPGAGVDQDTFPAIRAEADAGGVRRYRTLLAGPLHQCAMALTLASRGYCRDAGAIPPPPKPARAKALRKVPWRRALSRLEAHIDRGLRHRRARRLICGPVGYISGIRYLQATLVLADRPHGGPTLLDLRCKSLGGGGPSHVLPVPLATVKRAPDSAAITQALDRAFGCLEDGGRGCLATLAPLDRLVRSDLAQGLTDSGHDDREATLASLRRALAGGPGALSDYLLRHLRDRCGDIDRLEAPSCYAGAPGPAPPVRALPRGLPASQSARARALLDLDGARTPSGPLEARTIACGDLRATAVFVQPKAGLPALVDLSCR